MTKNTLKQGFIQHLTFPKNKLGAGFTLIELLVVIAIIGILASVVLASLNSARGRSADSAIKAELGSIRTQADIYNTSTSYVGLFSDPRVQAIVTSIAVKSGTAVIASSSAQAWMAKARLVSDPTLYFCVDSTGKANTTTSNAAAMCP